MRRLVCTLLIGAVLGATAGSVPVRAGSADDLPYGFTDGLPVGVDPGSEGSATSGPDATGGGLRAATVQRYFGRGPWDALVAAAATTSRPCTLSDGDLLALALAPVFKESAAGTSPSTVPAPMTMSRYDEWNGVYSNADNRSANYGLYAFRDPSTTYKRAFWHPGIGIWQYDSSGVGGPFTAVERMDVNVVGRDVVASMAARYCSPSPSVVGHGAPFTDQERRNMAWWPWGLPCTFCEAQFQAMTTAVPAFSNITLVDGVSASGGVATRTCTLTGVPGTVPCWYVKPAVGTIEGATSWATIAPLDGGSPTVAPTPLAAPFYVVDRGATEERHWLRADTGYGIDISGVRTIGKNDRPLASQAGSGVSWSSTSGLCDVDRHMGACGGPTLPGGLSVAAAAVDGTFRPIVLDAHGDGIDDVIWYASGTAADLFWTGKGSGTFTSTPTTINAAYDDVLVLDIDADGDDDVVWYARSTGLSYLWQSKGNGTWQSLRLTRPKGLRPFVVDSDRDGRDEIFWYGPGAIADAIWEWKGTAFGAVSQVVQGTYTALPGDFDGDGRTDVFWYAPGTAADALWLSTGLGAHRSIGTAVSGSYQPLVADLDGDGPEDIFWYAPGSPGDSVWFGMGAGGFTKVNTTVSGVYQPVLADIEGDGGTDVLWYVPGTGSDRWWRWGSDRVVSGASLPADGTQQPVVGTFGSTGADSILWYGPGTATDLVWWR